MRLASGRPRSARAAGRVLLAVASAAMAAGAMASTASAATASITRPAARTATMVAQSGGCQPWQIDWPGKCGNP